MWFEDLSPCNYFAPHGASAALTAVGWLERGKPYASGDVDRRVYDTLVAMAKDPWQPVTFRGIHRCDLCRFECDARGWANLFIPAEGILYVCPEMITHHINAHGYAPPEVFCRAVLACPPMKSMEYRRALKAAGGAGLLRPPGEEDGG